MENTEESLKDWRWQLSHSIKSIKELEEQLELTEDEKQTINPNLPIKITPYYLGLIKDLGKDHPLRKCVIPSMQELQVNPNECVDPLDEDKYSPVKGIVHKYKNRALFLTTNTCSTNCQYCTRSRIIEQNDYAFSGRDWKEAINYIEQHPVITDVIISGGDFLTYSDNRIKDLLTAIKRIKHVEIIRIGTKTLATLPSRITPSLTRILKQFSPLFMSLHFTHASEITSEVKLACNMLANSGIVMRSQTVMLKGVNADIETMRELMNKLLTIRVSPYYIYYPDYVIGSNHFRPSIDTALEIMKELRATCSGLAVPNLVFDGKHGKIVVHPENIIENSDSIFKLRANNGEIIELQK